jgi:hypothetical protein
MNYDLIITLAMLVAIAALAFWLADTARPWEAKRKGDRHRPHHW